MILKFNDLLSTAQAGDKDNLLLISPTGDVRRVSMEVLGRSFSSTSLFLSQDIITSRETITSSLCTSDAISKYLKKDTTSDIYLLVAKGKVSYIKATVVYQDEQELHPYETQATDIDNNLLYWNYDPSKASKYNPKNGYPAVSEDGYRIDITTDITDFPVKVYRYYNEVIKVTSLNDEKDEFLEEYPSNLTDFKGAITKSSDSFIFKATDANNACGIQIKKSDASGQELIGELIGTWQGLNDSDPTLKIDKDNLKEYIYQSQDINSYFKSIALDTSNKIGWYLMADVSNKVFTIIEDSVIKIELGEVKTNQAGGYPIEQARNIFGNLLYWKEEMLDGLGVTSYGIPTKNSIIQYTTIIPTNYPVYTYTYTTKELCSFEYVKHDEDNSYGIKLDLLDYSGRTASIYKTDTELILKNVDNSLKLGTTGGSMSGTWLLNNKSLEELPSISSTTKDKFLSNDGSSILWKEITKELPSISSTTKAKFLSNNGSEVLWDSIPKELPSISNTTKDMILSNDGESSLWVEKDTPLPNIPQTENYILASEKGELKWDLPNENKCLTDSTSDASISISFDSLENNIVVQRTSKIDNLEITLLQDTVKEAVVKYLYIDGATVSSITWKNANINGTSSGTSSGTGGTTINVITPNTDDDTGDTDTSITLDKLNEFTIKYIKSLDTFLVTKRVFG